LVAGAAFLENVGVSLLVRALFVLSLGFSHLNLVQGPEARPYIILEASVMGLVWAYHRYLTGKGGLPVLIAVAAAGILFHPFFVAYLGLFLLLAPALLGGARARLLSELRSPSRVILWSAAGFFLLLEFYLVGKVSWFQTLGEKLGMDPYEYIGRAKSLPRFMIGTFFYPFGIPAAGGLSLLYGLAFWKRRSPGVSPLWRNLLLITLVLVITQVVLVVAVLQSRYWILQRQWIAGNGLAFLVAALLAEIGLRSLPVRARTIHVLCFTVLLLGGAGALWATARNLRAPLAPAAPLEQSGALEARIAAQKVISPTDFETLAHQNLLRGGPVWPVFRRLYSQ
jgi:hypothetical protein